MQPADFQHLPEEIKLHIFSFLDDKNLLKAACVSKVWKAISEDDYLWRPLTQKRFRIIQKFNTTWKEAFLDYARIWYRPLKPAACPEKAERMPQNTLIKRVFELIAGFYLMLTAYRSLQGRYRVSDSIVSEDLIVMIAMIATIWHRIQLM